MAAITTHTISKNITSMSVLVPSSLHTLLTDLLLMSASSLLAASSLSYTPLTDPIACAIVVSYWVICCFYVMLSAFAYYNWAVSCETWACTAYMSLWALENSTYNFVNLDWDAIMSSTVGIAFSFVYISCTCFLRLGSRNGIKLIIGRIIFNTPRIYVNTCISWSIADADGVLICKSRNM